MWSECGLFLFPARTYSILSNFAWLSYTCLQLTTCNCPQTSRQMSFLKYTIYVYIYATVTVYELVMTQPVLSVDSYYNYSIIIHYSSSRPQLTIQEYSKIDGNLSSDRTDSSGSRFSDILILFWCHHLAGSSCTSATENIRNVDTVILYIKGNQILQFWYITWHLIQAKYPLMSGLDVQDFNVYPIQTYLVYYQSNYITWQSFQSENVKRGAHTHSFYSGDGGYDDSVKPNVMMQSKPKHVVIVPKLNQCFFMLSTC